MYIAVAGNWACSSVDSVVIWNHSKVTWYNYCQRSKIKQTKNKYKVSLCASVRKNAGIWAEAWNNSHSQFSHRFSPNSPSLVRCLQHRHSDPQDSSCCGQQPRYSRNAGCRSAHRTVHIVGNSEDTWIRRKRGTSRFSGEISPRIGRKPRRQ